MTYSNIVEELREENPEALLADGLEDALVGVARRCGQPSLAVYDVRKAAEVLIARDGMTYEDAMEYLEFNSIGAWVGPHTPIWLGSPEE
jgi:hypothetical protein